MAITIIDTDDQTADASSLTFNKSGSLQNGDVMVIACASTDDTSVTGPSGWTLARRNSDGDGIDRQAFCYYKVVTDASGEPSTFSVTGTSERRVGTLFTLRGVDNTDPVNVVTGQTDDSAEGDFDAQSVTTTVDGCLIIYAGVVMNGSSISNNSWNVSNSGVKQYSAVGNFDLFEYYAMATGYKEQTTAGATGVTTFNPTDWSSGGDDASVTVAFAPAADSGILNVMVLN